MIIYYLSYFSEKRIPRLTPRDSVAFGQQNLINGSHIAESLGGQIDIVLNGHARPISPKQE